MQPIFMSKYTLLLASRQISPIAIGEIPQVCYFYDLHVFLQTYWFIQLQSLASDFLSKCL